MTRIPFDKMVIGLDQLLLHSKINNREQTELQADLIDAFILGCGWSWSEIIAEMANEDLYDASKKN